MARCTKEAALETRTRILDAAEEIFHARGVAHTSLADIATAANVTRGAVYWHFKNKSDLFEAMCQRVRLPMEAMVEASADGNESDPLGQLRKTCLFVLQETARNSQSRKVFDILFHKCEFVAENDAIARRQRECFNEGQKNIERILENAVSKGQLPDDLNVRLASVALHAAIDGVLNNWLFSPTSFDLAADAEPLVDGVLDMVRHASAFRTSGKRHTAASQ